MVQYRMLQKSNTHFQNLWKENVNRNDFLRTTLSLASSECTKDMTLICPKSKRHVPLSCLQLDITQSMCAGCKVKGTFPETPYESMFKSSAETLGERAFLK
jgi:hypothetical protein